MFFFHFACFLSNENVTTQQFIENIVQQCIECIHIFVVVFVNRQYKILKYVYTPFLPSHLPFYVKSFLLKCDQAKNWSIY